MPVRRRFYHGGPSGLKWILPSATTGAKACGDFTPEAAKVCRRDRVYVTTSKDAALLYAVTHERGVVYEVVPLGELEPDVDCDDPELSFCCEKARVVRKVVFPDGARDNALRALMEL